MTETPQTVADQLLSLVARATGEDLSALDDTIAAKERELATLRKLRGVLSAGEPVTPKSGARPGRKRSGDQREVPTGSPEGGIPLSSVPLSVGDERRIKAARYILKNGSTPASALCRLFSIPNGSLTMTFDHEWFEKTDAGLDLTPRGRAAVRGDGPND